ncbi:ribonuclease T1 [Nocardioides albertanoniae]|uniref:Ribonuclease T1 n=1 Tax=Nocardioides albertanoniae TaxID=1175486 RepID=A0A543A9S0_9ACTN|nr:ribonuclease T1 [Nocardioides albertanoniae]
MKIADVKISTVLAAVLTALLMALFAGCGAASDGGGGQTGTDPDSGLAWIAESDLPPEGTETLDLIDAGGPFPYPGKDGTTFGNREGILPEEPSGYYEEYTVPTPGSEDRGARRIVAGEGGEFYYTEDHYESFSRIDRE